VASTKPYSAATWRRVAPRSVSKRPPDWAAVGQFAVASMDQRRVSIEHGGQLAHTAAQDGENSGNVIARMAASGQEELNAGGETIWVARVSPDHIIESGAAILGVPAIGVSSVIEKPLERLGLKVFARREENGEPAPAESVEIRAVAGQQFHDWYASWLGHSLQGHIVDQHLPQAGIASQQRVYARQITLVDCSSEIVCRSHPALILLRRYSAISANCLAPEPSR